MQQPETPERIEIAEGGWLLHQPRLYAPEEADALLHRLTHEVPWVQQRAYGQPLPRLNAWYADPGLRYAYSGLSHRGEGWPEWLLRLKERVERAADARFNSLLLNRYRDGQDSIGFHADAEPELGLDPVVATLSFGAEREFVLKRRKGRETLSYRLTHGSLLVMGGASQRHWLHGVPKTEEATGARISLTFRRIV